MEGREIRSLIRRVEMEKKKKKNLLIRSRNTRNEDENDLEKIYGDDFFFLIPPLLPPLPPPLHPSSSLSLSGILILIFLLCCVCIEWKIKKETRAEIYIRRQYLAN